MSFSKKCFFTRLFMPLEELNEYYRNKRKHVYENNILFKGIKMRDKIHKPFIAMIALANRVSGFQTTVVNDRRSTTDKPIIYACTHIGRYDVETLLCAIKSPCYLFYGDANETYRDLLGLLVWLNGSLYFDTAYKEDRMIAKERGIQLLRQGGNILVFPEGAWNITENQIVMRLFRGTAEMAIRGKADVIPIAIDQKGKKFFVNIGENIECEKLTIEKSNELTERLRDILATLKWEIWEEQGVCCREEIPKDYNKTFLDEIMAESNTDYTLEDIIATRYKDKKNLQKEEVFLFKDNLIPSKNNLFLYRPLYYHGE